MMNRNTKLSETFAVSKGDLERITTEALRRGGNYCDLFFESTFFSTLLLRDGEVSSGGHHEDYGCGIRVLSGEKTGYAYSESTEMDQLLQAARAAAEIADGNASERPSIRRQRRTSTPCVSAGQAATPPALLPGSCRWKAESKRGIHVPSR